MGQCWLPVNLSKREFLDPHKLGSGLKLWEQVNVHPGPGTALLVLLANMPEERGGGDLVMGFEDDLGYEEIAKRTIGRWAGDRIALIGDRAENGDLPGFRTKEIAAACFKDKPTYKDITDDVCRVIEHELDGKFQGDWWRYFVENSSDQSTEDQVAGAA